MTVYADRYNLMYVLNGIGVATFKYLGKTDIPPSKLTPE
jgi:hypothetical protein